MGQVQSKRTVPAEPLGDGTRVSTDPVRALAFRVAQRHRDFRSPHKEDGAGEKSRDRPKGCSRLDPEFVPEELAAAERRFRILIDRHDDRQWPPCGACRFQDLDPGSGCRAIGRAGSPLLTSKNLALLRLRLLGFMLFPLSAQRAGLVEHRFQQGFDGCSRYALVTDSRVHVLDLRAGVIKSDGGPGASD